VQPAICWNIRVSRTTHRVVRSGVYDSDNVTGADNQQERLRVAGWITGFVDGEGCFAVPMHRNPTSSVGWQVQPQFVVVQGASSVCALEVLRDYFGCGRINMNVRRDNHREPLYRYIVRRFSDLTEVIVPFFQTYRLRTAKAENFDKFVEVLELMKQRRHLSTDGLIEIARITETMNRRKPSSFAESSEATRRPPPLGGEDMVRASRRREEAS
jgi:LAGLIDADG DNA endonuclease family protein